MHLSSHFISPSLTLATHYNARSSSFTLSNADILRTATLVGGALQSSTINGHHSLAGTLPNASFSYSVATSGGITYAADGTPASGLWTITLPNALITVTVANGTRHDRDRRRQGRHDRPHHHDSGRTARCRRRLSRPRGDQGGARGAHSLKSLP